MNNQTKIQIQRRNVYGNELLYVISAHAHAVSVLTGKKTVSYSDLRGLEQLGFLIEIK